MAQETTTIEVTTEQAETLEDLKRDSSESYKSVLQVLIDGYSDDSGDEPTTQITYDDVKAACASAVRDELPEELR